MKAGAAALGTLFVWTIACVENLPLGSECAEKSPECGEKRPAPAAPMAPSAVPAATPAKPSGMDARVSMIAPSRLDAGPPPGDDGSSEEPPLPTERPPEQQPPSAPLVANGSFELNWGMGGSLGLGTESGELELNVAAPWGACRPGYYRVLSSADGGRPRDEDLVEPRDAEYFIEYTAREGEWSALRQTLAAGLERGQHYAFALDVRASAGEQATIEVWGSLLPCLVGLELTKSEPFDDAWRTICLSFDAPADLGDLLLRPVATPGVRVFFDHLRSDPSCL